MVANQWKECLTPREYRCVYSPIHRSGLSLNATITFHCAWSTFIAASSCKPFSPNSPTVSRICVFSEGWVEGKANETIERSALETLGMHGLRLCLRPGGWRSRAGHPTGNAL